MIKQQTAEEITQHELTSACLSANKSIGEKEELVHALHNQQANNVSAKLAQSIRKKVQELETKIAELTRKCSEETRVMKIKEKSDQQMKNLLTEIHSLKQARVNLISETCKEGEEFTQWKRASARELGRLKDQDRKRQNEMVKLQTQNSEQQNVYEMKMKEALAVNESLKESLQLQCKVLHELTEGILVRNALIAELRQWIMESDQGNVEKEERLQALHNQQANNVSAKLAQSIPKKVRELETKIAELTRKCSEETTINKIKEKSEQQFKNLLTEIHSLKQARVDLISEMRKESEEFDIDRPRKLRNYQD